MTRSLDISSRLSLPGLNWGRLNAYLSKHGHSLDPNVAPRQFSTGYGNMNFLLRIDDELSVLRRPPEGPVPPGAHDMAREFRILSHLHDELPLVPKAKLFCDNPDVIGAVFFVMEYRPGLVIGAEISSDINNAWKSTTPIGQFLGRNIINVLANLHDVDVYTCGLGNLGRPEGFLNRTMRGWAKRAYLSWQDAPPSELGVLLDWLDTHQPKKTNQSTLIHNDFKLDNIILDPETLKPRTLIDWDMGTLGDPLYDLAVLLSYWSEASDPEAMHQLQQMPTADHGFPTREQAAAQYSYASGRDLQSFRFHRVLATLRLAVVFQQLYRRFETGGTNDPKFAKFDDLARGLLRFGVDVAHGRNF
jgi:aminoglycoside phosphotransferase (APT) family kinase protein